MITKSQSPHAVVMVRPHFFTPNPQTVKDNSFQKRATLSTSQINSLAFHQVNQAIDILRSHGVVVHVFDDTTKLTPDSVFPNNWFSTHHDGQMAIYPMYCKNRRLEVNPKIIDALTEHYHVSQVVDYSDYANQDIFLEGTGAMVLDHQNRLAYAVRSKRMNEYLLQQFCQQFNYQAMTFDACDQHGIPIYHTNVLMSVATNFVMICLDMMSNSDERAAVVRTITQSGKTLIELTEQQISHFAGNTLELSTPQGPILALSQTAYQALTHEQKQTLASLVKLVPIDVSAIELAGGSIRCMLAGIHLTAR